MGNIATSGGAGGGTGSDECTAVLAHVLAGETAVTSDSGDEPRPGTMTVNSLLSFSCAAYSGRRVLAKWQNPRAAIGKPYSGVYIRYSTGGYPGKTGGTQIYKGAGNNAASEGQSQTYLDLPALNTTYYLSIYPYVTCNAGEMTGGVINTSVKTAAQLILTIKGTQNYTIPIGYSQADIFCVGGGGAGSFGNYDAPNGVGGGGGGAGYTATANNIAISAGQVLSCMVGAGGEKEYSYIPKPGAASSVSRNGITLITANGGGIYSTTSNSNENTVGGPGGSGGGAGGYKGGSSWIAGYPGGADGSNGGQYYFDAGAGQGRTTRAFGEANGTLYAGGGGGGTGSNGAGYGAGGAGGGGTGGAWFSNGGNASANTGGGGGGAGGTSNNTTHTSGGNGGSGLILIRLK